MTTPTPRPGRAPALSQVARRLLRPVLLRAAPVAFRARRTWRRSLQFRMVTITVVASGLLVSGFGFLVAERNNSALLEAAHDRTSEKLQQGAEYLTEQLKGWRTGEEPDLANEVQSVLTKLASSPEQGGDVIVAVTFDNAPATVRTPVVAWPEDDFEASAGAITSELRADVSSGSRAYQVTVVGDRTFLVYGRPVLTPEWSYPQIEVYYLVPLNSEVDVAETFRATVFIVGLTLVALLAILVVLVTRLVARPVRLAAQTAQRLSAGLLDQRMVVKGEDELALLADAFNQMAANLQRQIVRLEDMSRVQRRFTSDVSHELRTPLTTVRMAADVLHAERDSFDPAVARSAELLQAELNRFEELLTDLLEISRFDAGFAMLDSEPADLVALVNRVTDRLNPVAKRCGVEIEVVTPKPPVIAEVDARRVERILRNLIDNAVDHGQGRPVTVTLGVDSQAVAVTVRDHGLGLKPGEEKLVFNRFWRSDPSRARQTGGTGLGLSISVEDARLHGGWLEAWGSPGRGAQFRLTLPVRSGRRLAGSPLPLVPADAALVPPQMSLKDAEVPA